MARAKPGKPHWKTSLLGSSLAKLPAEIRARVWRIALESPEEIDVCACLKKPGKNCLHYKVQSDKLRRDDYWETACCKTSEEPKSKLLPSLSQINDQISAETHKHVQIEPGVSVRLCSPKCAENFLQALDYQQVAMIKAVKFRIHIPNAPSNGRRLRSESNRAPRALLNARFMAQRQVEDCFYWSCLETSFFNTTDNSIMVTINVDMPLQVRPSFSVGKPWARTPCKECAAKRYNCMRDRMLQAYEERLAVPGNTDCLPTSICDLGGRDAGKLKSRDRNGDFLAVL